MNVTLCSALWHRHALAPIWWAGVERLRRRFASHGITLTVTVAGSEPFHRALARQHGATWVQIANRPLGRKWNAAVHRACTDGTDYILILGADDFLGDSVVDWYAHLIAQGWLYLGLAGIYFYEPSSQRLARFQPPQARYGSPIGAGRLVHRDLLRRESYRPWLDCLTRRLDHDMATRCQLPPGKLLSVNPARPALDVKTGANLWPYDRLKSAYPPVEEYSGRLDLPEWEAIAALSSLRDDLPPGRAVLRSKLENAPQLGEAIRRLRAEGQKTRKSAPPNDPPAPTQE